VIPDDQYTANSNSSNTHTLQHYLSIKIYFTSHAHFHFLPGQYYLNTDLIIQRVSNLSIIGNRTDEGIITVIKCTSPAGIEVVGSRNIVIANIVMINCGKNYYRHYYAHGFPMTRDDLSSLSIVGGKFITIDHFYVRGTQIYSGLLFINVMGNLTDLLSHYILIRYDDSTSGSTYVLHVSYCFVHSKFHTHLLHHALELQQINSSSNTTVIIENSNFISRLAILNICINCSGNTIVTVSHCYFTYKENDILIHPEFDFPYEDYDIDDYYDNGNHHFNDYNYYDDYDNNKMSEYNNYNFQDDYYFYDDKVKNYDDLLDEILHPPPTGMVMVSSNYENCKNDQMPNKIQFINCHFGNISADLYTITRFEMKNQAGNSTLILIVNTTFYNCTRDLTAIHAGNHISKFKSHYEPLHIKDTKIQSFS